MAPRRRRVPVSDPVAAITVQVGGAAGSAGKSIEPIRYEDGSIDDRDGGVRDAETKRIRRKKRS